jgi:tetratricopeptide (TPR) repeat protein
MLGKGYRGVFSRMGEGLLEKLLEDIKRELEKDPDNPDLLYKLGMGYVRLGKTDSAREVYKRLKNVDPEKARDLLDSLYEV